MRRPTFAMVRQSSLPTAIGRCAADISALLSITNEAQERLLMDPLAPEEGWFGSEASMLFAVNASLAGTTTFAYLTAPREVARLTGIDVCQQAISIRNSAYEYLQFGPGLQPRGQAGCCGPGPGCSSIAAVAYGRDNVITLKDFPTVNPAIIRIYPTDPGDAGKRVLVRGNDQNGMPVFTIDPVTQQSISGEWVTLTLPFAQTLNSFTPPLQGLDKQVTLGMVTVWAVDPVSGNQTQVSSMMPNETTSAYRRYLLNNLPKNCCGTPPGNVTVTARARLDFIPVMSDPDYLMIQSIPALIQEAMAIYYERNDTALAAKKAAACHAKAISILNGQLDMYAGKTEVSVRVPIFGSDRMRPQPL